MTGVAGVSVTHPGRVLAVRQACQELVGANATSHLGDMQGGLSLSRFTEKDAELCARCHGPLRAQKRLCRGSGSHRTLAQWDVVSQAVEGGLRGAGVGVWTCQALAAPWVDPRHSSGPAHVTCFSGQ